MRREYGYLLGKYRDLLAKCDSLESSLNRALDVLAAKEKAREM